ncbi:hypothetical protein HZC20_01940 [Candidatus Peregrinibacteria bacterium]|nr:hypothetical protein [Candidatus Peregrinibacteria bacterium]
MAVILQGFFGGLAEVSMKFIVACLLALGLAACAVEKNTGTTGSSQEQGLTQGALTIEKKEGQVPCNGACSKKEKCDEVAFPSECVPLTEVASCNDGKDNDKDGKTDCADADCSSQQLCCVPQCGSGKICGPDGCGGSCGLCPGTSVCSANQKVCQCVPDCKGRVCGPDGCGGSCGTCGVGASSCSLKGVCLANEATCDDGIDNDGDGKTDAQDGDCAKLDIGKVGVYFPPGQNAYVKFGTAVESVELGYYPVGVDSNGNGQTIVSSINGNDGFLSIWINAKSVNIQSGIPFLVWTPGVSPGKPQLPIASSLSMKTFNSTFPTETWINVLFYGSGYQPPLPN